MLTRRLGMRDAVAMLAVAAASAAVIAVVATAPASTAASSHNSTSLDRSRSLPRSSSPCAADAVSGDLSSHGQGSKSAWAAVEAWVTDHPRLGDLRIPRRGWTRDSLRWADGEVAFDSGSWQVSTVRIPGRGWFVASGAAPC